MQDASLTYVDSLDTAQDLLAWLGQRRPVLAIDTETTGLEWDAEVRLLQLGDAEGGYAIPIREWRGIAQQALSIVRDSGSPVVMHNAAFDQHRLHNNGFATPLWSSLHDTEIMARLVWPDKRGALKATCDRVFGPQASAGQALLKEEMRKNRWDWATVPTDNPLYYGYGVLDTVLTARLYEHLLPLVPSTAYEREMAVRDILFHAEQRGIRIDREYTTVLLSEWREEAAALRKDLQDAGIKNPGSNHQVSIALKDAGWQPEEFTYTGQPKLDKAILTALDARFPGLAAPLLRYRRLVKWSSTYLESFLHTADDQGRIHPNIRTLGARTGRMSVTNPAFQTLPSREAAIRNCVLPYEDDEVLYALDYSNMEMRIFAAYTGDPNLCAAANTEDFHKTTAAMVYEVPVENVTPEQRSHSKATNFGNVFGQTPAGMASTAGVETVVMERFLNAFNARFPGSEQFKDRVQTTIKRRIASDMLGTVTTIGGRVLPVDDDRTYSGVNYLCQGGAADVFKDALIALDNEGLSQHIVLPVHDEVLFSFPSDDAPELSRKAQAAMTDSTSFSVPLTVDVDGPLARWGDKYQ